MKSHKINPCLVLKAIIEMGSDCQLDDEKVVAFLSEAYAKDPLIGVNATRFY